MMVIWRNSSKDAHIDFLALDKVSIPLQHEFDLKIDEDNWEWTIDNAIPFPFATGGRTRWIER